jgi:DNA-binding SARP family transcriptional activator
MRYRILGPLEIDRDGVPVGVPAAKQRTLLGALLLHRGEILSTERLVDELWGENPPATATKTIQVYVSQLRKLLGEDAIETRPPGTRCRRTGPSSTPDGSSS